MAEKYQAVVVATIVLFMIATGVFGYSLLDKMERLVAIAERTEQKADRILTASAPVGEAAVRVSAKMIDTMDRENLGKSAARGIKEIGEATKKRLVELLEKRSPDTSKKTP